MGTSALSLIPIEFFTQIRQSLENGCRSLVARSLQPNKVC